MLTFPTINPSVVHQFIKTEQGCKTLHYYLFLSIPQASQFLDELMFIHKNHNILDTKEPIR